MIFFRNININIKIYIYIYIYIFNLYLIKGSLGGEISVLRIFRMSGKKLVKERVNEGKS